MPELTLPFEVQSGLEAHEGDPFSCALYRMLPEPMQETARESVYLLEYLHTIPIESMGIPEYYPELSRGLEDLEEKNLIYPVEGGLYIHIVDDPVGDRGY